MLLLTYLRKYKKNIAALYFALTTSTLSALSMWSGIAQAQIQISPMVVEESANRGQVQGIINITNSGSTPIRARLYSEFFIYSNDGFKTIPTSANDLSPYLQFSPRELVLPPETTRRVRLLAGLAPNLPDGEYRAVVFTENLQEETVKNSSGSGVSIKTRIGVTVYVRKGNLSTNLAVDSAKFNDKQQQIQISVRNTGQVSASPLINWNLKQGDKLIKTGKLTSSWVTFQNQRNFLLNFPEKNQPVAPGNYQLNGELIWGENNNRTTVPFNFNLTLPSISVK
jgi:hypothetical protein